MFKSLSEMKKVMMEILKSVRDEKFSVDELYSKYAQIDVNEAIFTCVNKELITGIEAYRSAANTVIVYPSTPTITYDGLAFIEEN